MATIINPTSMTEQEILSDLEAWIDSQPDTEGWDEAFAGANGRTILELVAGSGAFLSYQARAARLESNVFTAKLLSSVLAIAYTLGYPVNRRRAARLLVSVTNTREEGDPLGDSIRLSRMPILGLSGSPPRPVSVLDTDIPALGPGQSAVVRCALGEWVATDARTAADSDFAEITFDPPTGRDVLDIDNDAVTLTDESDGTGIPLTRYLELSDDDPKSVTVKTHPTSLAFLFGADGFGVPSRGRTCRAGLLVLPARLGSDSDSFGTFQPNQGDWRGLRINSVVLLERELPADDLRKIARVVPGYFAAKRRMVTPGDHQAIMLAYGGMLDAALESGSCYTVEGEPLAEESIRTEDACSAAGGLWRERTLAAGCINVVAYVRASTARPGEPIRYEEGEDIPIGSAVGYPKRLSDSDELALEAYLRNFQGLGSEVLFRPGIPVRLSVSLAYRTGSTEAADVGLSGDQLLDFTAHVHAAVKRQCFQLGGTFDISRLQRDIEQHPLVFTTILHTPRNNMTLSWLGYFDYRDDADIRIYSAADLGEQGTDTVVGSGYLLPVRASQATLELRSVGGAERAAVAFAADSALAIPNRSSQYDVRQLGYGR